MSNQGPVKIVDAYGVHGSMLDQSVLEQKLYAEHRLVYPKQDTIFVFGSNEAGIHGAGAAAEAHYHRGAQMGVSFGPTGRCFAIPTKNAQISGALSLADIKAYVDGFLKFARERPHTSFQITCLGCGLAGLRNEQIAPMFYRAPVNCLFDTKWIEYLPYKARYWGTF
jgi:hypothetical protein